MAPYEAIEGNDVAGYIEQVGEGVTDFKKGDKVRAWGEQTSRSRSRADLSPSDPPAARLLLSPRCAQGINMALMPSIPYAFWTFPACGSGLDVELGAR